MFNKSNFVSLTATNQNLKKKTCGENKFKSMGTKCTHYSKSWKFYCSVIQGLILTIKCNITQKYLIPEH
jgi:flavin reductase (DIM6/NTAB) family NADH-FMN oxidoreductase RutF